MSDYKVLAEIQQIESVREHTNADKLVIVSLLGYDTIIDPTFFGVTKENCKQLVGLRGVYFYNDSVIPERLDQEPSLSFLKKSYMGKRVSTIRLRGEYSEGLFLNFETALALIDPELFTGVSQLSDLSDGADVTNLFSLTKYYAKNDPESTYTGIDKNGNRPQKTIDPLYRFPEYLVKTDQPSLQKMRSLLKPIKEDDGTRTVRELVATLKVDGQSATFFFNPSEPDEKEAAGICSRNLRIRENSDTFSRFDIINKRHKILEKLRMYNKHIAVQGELYGTGINGNCLKINEYRFVVFQVYCWDPVPTVSGRYKGSYMNFYDMESFCNQLDLPMVPVIFKPSKELPTSHEEWMTIVSTLTYDSLSETKGLPAEGVVIQTTDRLQPFVSCKVVSRNYLVTYGK